MLYTMDYVLNVIWCEDGPTDPQNRVSASTLRAALTAVAKHTRWADGSGSYPTQDTLHKEGGMSRATLNRALKVAVDLGWLEKEKSAPNRSRGVTYKIVIPEGKSRGETSQGETSQGETSHHETTNNLTMRQTIVSPRDTNSTKNRTLNKDQGEQQAAPRTHERAEAPVRESQPPAASPAPVLVDKSQTQQQGQQEAASATRQAPTQDAAPSALEGWLGAQLDTRGEALTRQTDPLTPAQLGAAARAVVALANGDETRARAYVTARLDAFELRGPERPVTRRALLKFLIDRRDWLAWEREEAAAQAPPPLPARPTPERRHPGSAIFVDPVVTAAARLMQK